MNRLEAHGLYEDGFRECGGDGPVLRRFIAETAKRDLFFLLYFVLGRRDVDRDWIYDRCVEVGGNPNGYVDLWSRFHYKMVGVDELVPTPVGFRRHGDLEVGDFVFGSDGVPVKVLARTEVFTDGDCYRVTFDKGYSVIVGGDHRWVVDVSSKVRVGGGRNNLRVGRKRVELDTRSLKSEVDESCCRSTRVYPSVPLCSPLRYPAVKLPVAPYVLGAWLGDGTSTCGSITCGDPELFAEVVKTDELGGDMTPARNSAYRNVVGLRRRLIDLGVMQNKHIPDLYQFTCVDDRIALLQGLMDTDGACDTRGTATFVNINERLAHDVFVLAAGLGLKPSFRKHHGLVKGEDYPYFQVSFQARSDSFPVFRLARKQERATGCFRSRSSRHAIVSVERIDSSPCSCIQVDRPDGLYLLGEQCITTKNSSIITFALTIQDILNNPELTFGIFSHTRPIAKGFLRQIKREFEGNEFLKSLYPEVLFEKPERDSPKWSLAVDTPVLTVGGWKNHGDLVVGDRIFGSRGQVITVIGNSGVMEGVDCRRVRFDDCELIASSEHLWPVQQRKATAKRWRWLDNPVVEIMQTDALVIGGKAQRFQATPAVDFPDDGSELPLDPYILGLWLGDGTAGTNIISMAAEDEADVLAQIENAGFEYYVHRKKPEDNFAMYGVRGLKEILDGMGCLRQKHIPDRYLYRSIADRLALLQGLMDSDGTSKRYGTCAGMCMFSNTNKALADGVFYLAASLGMRPGACSFQPKQPGHKLANHVYFVGLKSMPPFRSARKLSHCKEKRHKVGRYLRAVEHVPSVPVNCIRVDSDDHLYLAGRSLVATHNSEDDGLIVRRKSNPKESTIEAWGLVDGQPTSRHYDRMIYDDVVTIESVSSPEMIDKTTKAWEISLNLLSEGGESRYVGTRYHYSDTYRTIMDREAAIPRIHVATDNGRMDGNPVLLDRERLQRVIRSMGSYTAACQLFQNPLMNDVQKFMPEWLRYYSDDVPVRVTPYILVDPANEKKKRSDYTAMFVVGIGEDENFYVLDMVRDRLNLTERADRLFELHRKWRPLNVGYEKYGMQADIDHMKDRMRQEGYWFSIIPLGGNMSKEDRIRRLVPLFEQGRVFFPASCLRRNHEGAMSDLTLAFVEQEYNAFPFGSHDDMMDCLARITEESMSIVAPRFFTRVLKKASDVMIDAIEKPSSTDDYDDYYAREAAAFNDSLLGDDRSRRMDMIYDLV